jgi:hypothetical protein
MKVRFDPLDFALSYDAEIVDAPPSGDSVMPRFVTSATVLNRGPWIHVRITPRNGHAWTGAFEMDQLRSSDSLTGLFGLPSGQHLLVVAAGQGYVVSVNDPGDWHCPPIAPVLGVRRVSGAPTVALWDFQDLAAYGPEGIRWRIDCLATDDLEILSASENVIEGRVWYGWLPSTERVTFRVEASSGRWLGSAPPPEQHALLRIGADSWD